MLYYLALQRADLRSRKLDDSILIVYYLEAVSCGAQVTPGRHTLYNYVGGVTCQPPKLDSKTA